MGFIVAADREGSSHTAARTIIENFPRKREFILDTPCIQNSLGQSESSKAAMLAEKLRQVKLQIPRLGRRTIARIQSRSKEKIIGLIAH
jgi:hypothetical protein